MGGEETVIDKEVLLKFYGREDVQEAIYEDAKDREIGIKYDFGYGKRPDIINNPADVLELVKQGATSFHFSEELWHNPLQLSPEMSKKELDNLRKGWDLIIDIDTPYFEYGKIASLLVIELLHYHGIKNIGVKFSGNKGFHIAIPFESFPSIFQGKPTSSLFPEAPRRIAAYMKDKIEAELMKRVVKLHDINTIADNICKTKDEIKGKVFEIVDIDTVLIASRHLCRMPYSFNEKSGLISIPIRIEDIKDFKREDAIPEKVKVHKFLERKGEEATSLLIESFDFNPKILEEKKEYHFEDLKEAIPEKFFPDCIKKIFEGMEDGKKRCLFILISFLQHVGWSHIMIEERVIEWNKKNRLPLKEVYIKGQLRYAKLNKRLPPNVSNDSYYTGLQLPIDDMIKAKVKNPVNLARRRAFIVSRDKKG